jgi:membrane protease YdiL (CAAX protease family)
MKKQQAKTLLYSILLMAALQLLRIGIERVIYIVYRAPSQFGAKMVTMAAMLILVPLFVVYAHFRKVPLSVFPEKFGKWYILSTIIAAALLLSAPINYIEGLLAILASVYGSIVTPVFEELIFRGYLWNRLEKSFSGRRTVYLLSALLFMLWHIGYMLPSLASGNFVAVAWKLAAGLCYGLVLGALRLKTKNCYSTMLLHGVLNLFMI